MKSDTRLAGLIKVQIVPHHDVEKIVRNQRSIRRRLDMIAGNEKLLLSIRRSEDPLLRVLGAVCEKLQG